MSNTIKLIPLLLIMLNVGMAQAVPDSLKQQVLRDLQNIGFVLPEEGYPWARVMDAVENATVYKIVEAIPLIESRLWLCGDGIMYDMILSSLEKLQADNFKEVLKAVADTAEKILAGAPRIHESYFASPLDCIQKANQYLFKLNDFTYANRFVEYVRQEGGLDHVHLGVSMAGKLANAEPSFRSFVKTELIRIMYADTSERGSERFIASRELYDVFGNDALSDLTEYFNAKEDSSGMNDVIASVVGSHRYPQFESAIKLKLSTNRETRNRGFYTKVLLANYCTSENYQFVASYIAGLQDENEKNDLLFILHDFLVGIDSDASSLATPVNTLLDTLVSLKHWIFSFGWIADKNFVNELDNGLENARKHLLKTDSLKCAREVEKFQTKVSKEYKEANTHDKRFVTIEGWKFLYYNARYIIERLVKLPVERGTILQQIDSLKTELQNQNKQKHIGGAIFVKGLTLLIDKAKKELLKSDSSETALYIALFQIIVDESWELTQKKKSALLYVNDEAYISLYYRAKYILEALPEPKKNIQEHRLQMMNEGAFKEMQQELEGLKQ
jgi:hypothetical protein